jgi:hypothetical protein
VKPLKLETNAVLESASRLGNGSLPRYTKELKYLSAALIALLGEYGEDIEASSSKPGRPFDIFTLKGSGVGFTFRPNVTADCVNVIRLRLGNARQNKERDVDYAQTKVGKDFNVTRIADRALELHQRFLTAKSQEQMVAAFKQEGQHTVARLVAKIFGVSPAWEAPSKGATAQTPPLTAFQVGNNTGVRVAVHASAEGFAFTLTAATERMQTEQLEKTLRCFAAMAK